MVADQEFLEGVAAYVEIEEADSENVVLPSTCYLTVEHERISSLAYDPDQKKYSFGPIPIPRRGKVGLRRLTFECERGGGVKNVSSVVSVEVLAGAPSKLHIVDQDWLEVVFSSTDDSKNVQLTKL